MISGPAKLALLLVLLAGCGTAETPAPGQAPGGTSQPQASTRQVDAKAVADAPDPCTLLTPDQIAPMTGRGSTTPVPLTGDGERSCSWGDGEFHGAQLRLSEEGPGTGDAIDVGGEPGVVTDRDDYVCQVQRHVAGVAVSVKAIEAGGSDQCGHAAAALGAALDRLGW